MLRIGYIQSAVSTDSEKNVESTFTKIKELQKKGAEVIFLQELHHQPYFCQEENPANFSYAIQKDDELLRSYQQLCAELDIVLCVPFFEKRANGVYHNSCMVIDTDGSVSGLYRKMHIPDDPGYFEKYYFTPSDDGYKVFHTSKGKLGLLICWDQWFPEAARITALKGAEIIYYPTAIGWDKGAVEDLKQEELDAWITIQKSHAIANGVFVVSVNRCGTEGDLNFWGNSFVAAPTGRVLHSSGIDEDNAVVDIDLALIESSRQVWPFFRDRRIDSYGSIEKRLDDE